MKYKLLIGMMIFILLSVSVFAVPPVTTLQSSNGYTIETTTYQYVKAGQDFRAHFHVFNNSNGLRLSNTSVGCQIHIYSLNGSIMYDNDTLIYSGDSWNVMIDSSYFTEGKYFWFTHCNSSSYGGFIGSEYHVTETGSSDSGDIRTVAFAIGIIGIAFLFLYFAFEVKENHFLLSLIFIFLSLTSILLIPASIMNDYKATGETLIKLTIWTFRLFITYISIMLFWWFAQKSETINKLIDSFRGRPKQ